MKGEYGESIADGYRALQESRDRRIEALEAELAGDRRIEALEAELAELREAVREHLYRFHREGGAARLRQLIEEDERGPAATDSAISKARREEKP